MRPTLPEEGDVGFFITDVHQNDQAPIEEENESELEQKQIQIQPQPDDQEQNEDFDFGKAKMDFFK